MQKILYVSFRISLSVLAGCFKSLQITKNPESLLNEAVTKAELNITNLGEEIDMNCTKLIKQNSMSLRLLSTCRPHRFKVTDVPVTSVAMGNDKEDSQGYINKNVFLKKYLAIQDDCYHSSYIKRTLAIIFSLILRKVLT